MKNMVLCLCILLLLLLLSFNHTGMSLFNGVHIDSNHSLKNKTKISESVNEIQDMATDFVKVLVLEFPDDKHVIRLKRWSGVIRELPYNDKGILASNTNKGDYISLCMVDARGELNTRNEIIWVLLHELAHLMTNEYEHNSEFWKHNRFLVDQASKKGIYIVINYKEDPIKFCGDVLSYNF